MPPVRHEAWRTVLIVPSPSKSQFRLMAAVEHNPRFAKKVGIPQKVGKDFVHATKDYKSLPEKVRNGKPVRVKRGGLVRSTPL